MVLGRSRQKVQVRGSPLSKPFWPRTEVKNLLTGACRGMWMNELKCKRQGAVWTMAKQKMLIHVTEGNPADYCHLEIQAQSCWIIWFPVNNYLELGKKKTHKTVCRPYTQPTYWQPLFLTFSQIEVTQRGWWTRSICTPSSGPLPCSPAFLSACANLLDLK